MIRIFSSSDSLLVHHYQNLLEIAGISCFIKQSYLSGGVGELPPVECWPELWIEEDCLQEKASRLIRSADSGTQKTVWCCECGESHEHQFNVCWKCGRERKETL